MSRRATRELALRALFMIEQGYADPEPALADARASLGPERTPDEAFASELLAGILENSDLLDRALAPYLRGWSTGRLPAIDRTLLRLAVFELVFTDSPPGAIISEAVALAKRYSTPQSGRFLNGVLGSVTRKISQGGDIPMPAGPAPLRRRKARLRRQRLPQSVPPSESPG